MIAYVVLDHHVMMCDLISSPIVFVLALFLVSGLF